VLWQVYARAGVCPTRTVFDHWQAAAAGPLLLPLLRDGVRGPPPEDLKEPS
jgi:hypothetical protein